MMLASVVGVVALVLIVREGHHVPPSSRDARLPAVDALPGGLHSTPEQDALARRVDTEHAQAALADGRSFTPPMSPSVPYVPPPPRLEQAASLPPLPPRPTPTPQPRFVGREPPRPSPIVPAAASVPSPPAHAAAPAATAAPVVSVATPASSAQPNPYSQPIG